MINHEADEINVIHNEQKSWWHEMGRGEEGKSWNIVKYWILTFYSWGQTPSAYAGAGVQTLPGIHGF